MRDPLNSFNVKQAVAEKKKVKTFETTEKQVIVHCQLNSPYGTRIRIWPSTYLKTESGMRCPLISWNGISLAPVWRNSLSNPTRFTLIFSGLPSDCKVFSLIEDIPEENGFISHCITRNNSDIYQISF